MAIAKPKKPEKQVAAKRPPSGGGWSTAMKLAVIRGGEQSLSDLLFRYNLTPGTGGTWVRLMFCLTSSHVFYWCMTGMYYLVYIYIDVGGNPGGRIGLRARLPALPTANTTVCSRHCASLLSTVDGMASCRPSSLAAICVTAAASSTAAAKSKG